MLFHACLSQLPALQLEHLISYTTTNSPISYVADAARKSSVFFVSLLHLKCRRGLPGHSERASNQQQRYDTTTDITTGTRDEKKNSLQQAAGVTRTPTYA